MKNNRQNTSKEYESEEGQKMKVSEELDDQIINSNYSPNMKIVYSLIALIIVILIGLGIFIYFQIIQNQEVDNTIIKKRMEARPIQPESNMQPGQIIQLNKPLEQNMNDPEDNNEMGYKYYEMKHNKPDTLDLKYYKKYLPKKDENETFMDLNDIFNSKYLYIKNNKISYDYIYLIRQKDFKNDPERKASFKDKEFYYYKGTEANDTINLKDFYELCDNENLTQAIDKNYFINPLISVIISVYNVNQNLLRTIKSIQHQTFKNLEIIVVHDKKYNYTESCRKVIEQDFRIRIFQQNKFYCLWRMRMDGFLYSRGKYILHLDAGHILADNYVLEDIYNLADKYDLDTVRFSFSRTVYNDNFIQNKTFSGMKVYPFKMTQIKYGRPDYDVHQFGYGTIWNRLVRADMFSKGLDLVDGKILNTRKNLWEDMWWNDLIDRVSFSNLIVNRLGYIFLYNRNISFEPLISSPKKKDKTIREFIYFWYFDLILLPKKDDKKSIINTLLRYNTKNNTFCRLPMKLSFLQKKSKLLDSMIKKLMSDSYVSFNDRMLLKELLKKIKKTLKKKEEKEKKRLKKLKLKKKKLKLKKKKLKMKKKKELKKLRNVLKELLYFRNLTGQFLIQYEGFNTSYSNFNETKNITYIKDLIYDLINNTNLTYFTNITNAIDLNETKHLYKFLNKNMNKDNNLTNGQLNQTQDVNNQLNDLINQGFNNQNNPINMNPDNQLNKSELNQINQTNTNLNQALNNNQNNNGNNQININNNPLENNQQDPLNKNINNMQRNEGENQNNNGENNNIINQNMNNNDNMNQNQQENNNNPNNNINQQNPDNNQINNMNPNQPMNNQVNEGGNNINNQNGEIKQNRDINENNNNGNNNENQGNNGENRDPANNINNNDDNGGQNQINNSPNNNVNDINQNLNNDNNLNRNEINPNLNNEQNNNINNINPNLNNENNNNVNDINPNLNNEQNINKNDNINNENINKNNENNNFNNIENNNDKKDDNNNNKNNINEINN